MVEDAPDQTVTMVLHRQYRHCTIVPETVIADGYQVFCAEDGQWHEPACEFQSTDMGAPML